MTLARDPALAEGLRGALGAVEAAAKAPLSARHALHAAVALDQLSDLAYARRGALGAPLSQARDILSFRATLHGADASLAPLMDLVTAGADGPHLAVRAVALAEDGFDRLPVSDLMVSLYNAGTVPRLMLVRRDGAAWEMQALLQAAARYWQAALTA